MKTIKYVMNTRYLVVLSFSILLIASCKKDDINAPNLSVSIESIELQTAEDSLFIFDIKSNVDWKITSDQQWLDISALSGNGNATITLTASTNSTSAERDATVFVESEAGIKHITVKQFFIPMLKPNWTLEANLNKEFTITYVAQVSVNNEFEPLNEGDELAAFIGDQCRGIAQVDSNSNNCFILIFGNESDNSQLHFRYYSKDRMWIFETEAMNTYYSNQCVGSPDAPFTLVFE